MTPLRHLISATAALVLTSSSFAQAQFVETFDDLGGVDGDGGPSSLVSEGWDFRNQSSPLGSTGWSDGNTFIPQAGAGYLDTGSLATGFFGGQISSWILLPALPGQTAGDLLAIHLQRLASSNLDTVQIRYSPTGSTDTGSSSTDVGDFTSLLLDINPISKIGWGAYSAVLPGNGRIALRYFVDSACNSGCFGSGLGLDTLSVGTPPPPPCNLPPFPSAEQTVNWTAAGGPYEICNSSSIPAGGSVIVEAGTTVNIDPGSTLAIEGSIKVEGTASQPVTFAGGTSMLSPPIRVSGSAEFSFANIQGHLHGAHGSSLIITDCAFSVEEYPF